MSKTFLISEPSIESLVDQIFLVTAVLGKTEENVFPQTSIHPTYLHCSLLPPTQSASMQCRTPRSSEHLGLSVWMLPYDVYEPSICFL